MENVLLLLKDKKISQKKEFAFLDEEAKEILFFLGETKQKLDYAELCLDFTNDELMIDSFIYEILSLKKKLDYYLRLSKQKGICINQLNSLKKFSVSQ